MGLRIRVALVGVVVFMAVSSLAANHLVFPATGDSVALENFYAEEAGIGRYIDEEDVSAAVSRGTLVPIPITVSPRLPEWRRFLRPAAASFAQRIDGDFHEATGKYLVVDSAVRPVTVQRRLARHCRSAAPAVGQKASSHERGTTFDLAKRAWTQNGFDKMKHGQYQWLIARLGYYQALGKCHVIEEKACIHIFVRED